MQYAEVIKKRLKIELQRLILNLATYYTYTKNDHILAIIVSMVHIKSTFKGIQ
jgi:hypothetical protein